MKSDDQYFFSCALWSIIYLFVCLFVFIFFQSHPVIAQHCNFYKKKDKILFIFTVLNRSSSTMVIKYDFFFIDKNEDNVYICCSKCVHSPLKTIGPE